MTKSVEDNDGYLWIPYLDGVALHNVVYADEERGLVFIKDPIDPNYQCLKGSVVLKLFGEPEKSITVTLDKVSLCPPRCPHCDSPQEVTEGRCTSCERLIG